MARALREAGILERMITRRPDFTIEAVETEAFCAIAGLVGRKGVIDALMQPQTRDADYDGGVAELENSAIGLANGGRFEWFTPNLSIAEQRPLAANLRFITMTAPERRAVLAALPHDPEYRSFWEVDWRTLAMDAPTVRRARILDDFQTSFQGGHRNIGVQEQDYARAQQGLSALSASEC